MLTLKLIALYKKYASVGINARRTASALTLMRDVHALHYDGTDLESLCIWPACLHVVSIGIIERTVAVL